jgi:D-alanyl-D-alanine carboxypeptidase/D-alanyl-D-alanine-endopeptidase (penicillin-binding protein 4)
MNVKASIGLALALVVLPVRAEEFGVWLGRLKARKVQVSAGLWDLGSGKLLEGHQPDLALVPASTTKVISSYAILKTWKADFQLETEVYGDLRGDTVHGDLVFKGLGDPWLTTERIYLLAQDLKAKGVLKVTGRIRLDQSAFDGQRYGNGWGNTTSDTTPPILPLSVNCNRDDRGRIVSDPERLALTLIARILRETGISIEELPSTNSGEPLKILGFSSVPMRDLVFDINKYSNNFMIEMLVKRFGDGSWPRGIRRIQDFYQGVLDLGADKIQITDGSGLSKENRLSAKTLAIVLRAAWNDFEVGPEMTSSLKVIGGEPWKLSVKDPNLARRVRCKTGHLTDVNTVCGYLQTPDGKLRVFVILLNGPCSMDDVWEMVSAWAN